MLGKCWFVLKSPFPAPTLPAEGVGQARGPRCPGNLVPDLKRLNFVINSHPGPTKYPTDAPLWQLKRWDFNWKQTNSNSTSVSAKAATPLEGVGAETAIRFRSTVSDYWRFDCLETFELQLSPSYLQDSLEAPAVAKYVQDHKSPFGLWSMFMVTGIMVARGASKESSRNREFGVEATPQVEIPELGGVGGNIDLQHTSQAGQDLDYRQDDPFVWAIKLEKITKGIFDRKWSSKSYTKGSQFGLGDQRESEEQMLESLAEEGLGKVELSWLDGDDGGTPLIIWE
ncbi:hypothetical protein MAPG_06645 [Magnaporthiopsis poae ATCC 64411]|uniref:Uncharacterized protein n=1 Tax=Magnaporthiopsis poae (strain ATCC 64411 / 73-15) TaxID=644358 RepID=A0A0C4E2K4_MAGP6|nr:hypothetical protein MAPG_06645 [Magnaporthiopsis poae ATCC 64411]